MPNNAFRDELSAEVRDILSNEFSIEVTGTNTVPHSGDGAITYPNTDAMRQGTKLIETCVLYIDIRRSTELNFTHRQATVAKLYSAFVRAMTRCARQHNGHVRGIIGDRVMVMFDAQNCFVNAVETAISMNSVSQFVINKHFKANEVECGIGIDHGSMLATKTGVIRHGQEQANYRNLVWLGRPANVASKLTDIAQKPSEWAHPDAVYVAREQPGQSEWAWAYETLPEFVGHFEQTAWFPKRQWVIDGDIASFFAATQSVQTRPKTPAILMTKAVYDGYKAAKPNAKDIANGWWKRVNVQVPGNRQPIYGGDVYWTNFKT
jgi:class 3 adenylate cyclase